MIALYYQIMMKIIVNFMNLNFVQMCIWYITFVYVCVCVYILPRDPNISIWTSSSSSSSLWNKIVKEKRKPNKHFVLHIIVISIIIAAATIRFLDIFDSYSIYLLVHSFNFMMMYWCVYAVYRIPLESRIFFSFSSITNH